MAKNTPTARPAGDAGQASAPGASSSDGAPAAGSSSSAPTDGDPVAKAPDNHEAPPLATAPDPAPAPEPAPEPEPAPYVRTVRRVLCAALGTQVVNGVRFVAHLHEDQKVAISEAIDSEAKAQQAERFLRIPGYQIVELPEHVADAVDAAMDQAHAEVSHGTIEQQRLAQDLAAQQASNVDLTRELYTLRDRVREFELERAASPVPQLEKLITSLRDENARLKSDRDALVASNGEMSQQLAAARGEQRAA